MLRLCCCTVQWDVRGQRRRHPAVLMPKPCTHKGLGIACVCAVCLGLLCLLQAVSRHRAEVTGSLRLWKEGRGRRGRERVKGRQLGAALTGTVSWFSCCLRAGGVCFCLTYTPPLGAGEVGDKIVRKCLPSGTYPAKAQPGTLLAARGCCSMMACCVCCPWGSRYCYWKATGPATCSAACSPNCGLDGPRTQAII